MNSLFWWTGLAVWLAIALVLSWVLVEAGWATIVAGSATRFRWCAARKRGLPATIPALLRLPSVFVQFWPGFFGYRKGAVTLHEENGMWHGFGDWSVRQSDVGLNDTEAA